MRRTSLFMLATCLLASAAWAQDGDSMAGRTYAVQHCAECHDVGTGPRGPVRTLDAPAFKAIADAPTTTAIGLEVFLTTPHANMPNFIIQAPERGNVIAYILSLARKAKPRSL